MCTDKKLLFGFIIHFPSEYGENWGEGKLQAVSVSAWECYENGKGGEKTFSAYTSTRIENCVENIIKNIVINTNS